MVATLLQMKQEGYRPARDIILALTAGEESGIANGVQWLAANHPELIKAEFAINLDDWSIPTVDGKATVLNFYASEKLYADYQLTVTNPGGHSSEPPIRDNAIYTLTAGLDRLAAYQFPFELSAATRAYYERRAALESGQRAADMRAVLKEPPDPKAIQRLAENGRDRWITHTTCVPTRLEAGHANNALPQKAQAVINCRILPAHSAEEVRKELLKVLADPLIKVRYITEGRAVDVAPEVGAFAPARVPPEVLGPLQEIAQQIWPHIAVIPTISPGASDAVFSMAAGIPTFTFGAVTYEGNDSGAHGRDERVAVGAFYNENELFSRYLRAITAH
jgi:acetylornithine deacetylase/succinyl-diaminopimelate desuccinylase-like protein